MSEDELLTVHFFFRPQSMKYIYMYGAKVHFEDEDLLYSNAIISPGRSLISWHNDNTASDIILPELLNNVDYQFKIFSQEEPDDSLALALTTFNGKEQLDYKIFTTKEAKFSLESKETAYQFDLISLGNLQLHFQHILLAKNGIIDQYTFSVNDICLARTILVHYNGANSANKLHVRVRTYTSAIQTITYAAHEDHLFVFVPVQVDGQVQFTAEQLVQLAKYINKFRDRGYILQIENNQSTAALVKTIRQFISEK
ncbi:accessory Sec system protein Asp3 [Lactobacillus sp. ESL0679]|uniref:accessory Sec system protein Asp3 n=1 Tax=Lactobacillus sp. ESL0679 TaxID=2983209 RepID=UPI0023FA1163|nr:accessory Sec system protein Asp3 [Lactobacillus sp. ESL0679]MDF7683416.1 accessory Sec system protein Asp3 [Lactobacillus sp. ESL0679]